MAIPPLDRVNELLSYDPLTGIWTWRVDRARTAKAGDQAGCLEKGGRGAGYIRIMIDGRSYRAHILAWFRMTGEWPAFRLDHKNVVRSDNKWDNIRPAPSWHNNANKPIDKRNTSGFKGVSYDKKRRKFVAYIRKDGVLLQLGVFDNAKDGHIAYVKKAKELFGEYARAR